MAPSEWRHISSRADSAAEDTIERVSQRLLLWARRDGNGLARVEYASEFSRQRLLQQLAAEGVEVTEIQLPICETATEAVAFLLQALTEAAGSVVSVSGFRQAFQAQSSLADSLRTLNFNREALTAFPLRQIWWMTPVLLDTSLHAMPDMHGWFSPQLSLTEAITPQVGAVSSPVALGQEAGRLSQSNIDDARQRSRQLLAELAAAGESGAADVDLVATYLLPALVAIAEVGAREELRTLMVQHDGLLRSFYLVKNAEILAALDANAASTETILDFAQNLDKLVSIFYAQGLYAEAERLSVRALEIKKTELGDRHPFTATSLNNLAALYRSQGRYSEAEPLYVEALEISKTELGDRHPSTATSLNNLAGLYDSQGRYSEAEPLYVEALEIKKTELGDRHPSTATSLNNLAGLYRSQGRYSEAEPLYVEALEISKTELGDRHPSTADSLFNLAALYYNTQRNQQALDLIQSTIDIYIATLGETHPNTQAAISWRSAIQKALNEPI